MVRRFGLLIMILGLCGVCGCAQDPAESNTTDTKAVPIPEATVMYARAAVEVRKIKMSQMPEFEASIERMDRGERTALWLSLKELHDSTRPSNAAAPRAENFSEEASCTVADCSHSVPYCVVAQWCCAFGEDALFYAYDSDVAD